MTEERKIRRRERGKRREMRKTEKKKKIGIEENIEKENVKINHGTNG